MRRRDFLKNVGAAAAFGLMASATVRARQTKRPPNVVVIYTDDQLFETLGYLGGKVLTPRLDAMARNGLIFENHHCASTVCAPSRYSLLTGRYAGRCAHPAFIQQFPEGSPLRIENNVYLEKDGRNLPACLSKRGYITGLVGKWHLEPRERKSDYKSFPKNADPKDPAIAEAVKFNHAEVARHIMETCFDDARHVYLANLAEVGLDALNYHNIDWTVQGAHEFMEANRDQPFFLYFSTTLHHGPHPQRSVFGKERVSGEGLLDRAPDVMPSRKSIVQRLQKGGLSQHTAYCTWLDDAVGSLLDKVESLGLKKETLVIFTTDHGAWRHGKATCYDGGMHVPMIMYWPGTIKSGRRFDGLTQNIDIAPTILELAGAIPARAMNMDGKSLAGIVRGGKDPVHDSLFCELGYSRAVKTRDWKYIAIRYPKAIREKIAQGEQFNGWEGRKEDRPYLVANSHLGFHASRRNPHYFEMDQLYDLRKDPREENNVIEQYPQQAKKMKALLSNYLKRFANRPFGEFSPEQADKTRPIDHA